MLRFHFVSALFVKGSSLSELSISLSSDLEFTGATYVTFHVELPFLSFGISHLSS